MRDWWISSESPSDSRSQASRAWKPSPVSSLISAFAVPSVRRLHSSRFRVSRRANAPLPKSKTNPANPSKP